MHYRGADCLQPRLQDPQKRWIPGEGPRVLTHLPPPASHVRNLIHRSGYRKRDLPCSISLQFSCCSLGQETIETASRLRRDVETRCFACTKAPLASTDCSPRDKLRRTRQKIFAMLPITSRTSARFARKDGGARAHRSMQQHQRFSLDGKAETTRAHLPLYRRGGRR